MLTVLVPLITVLMQPAAQPAAKPPTNGAKPLHPVITEVLYAVPRDGDADQSGVRSPTGDEFIELVNPHDVPINLKGYTIRDARTGGFKSDRSIKSTKVGKPKAKPAEPGEEAKPIEPSPPGEHSINFTFPDLVLKPGEVVVVFNGYESKPAGPVGDKDHAAVKNPKFHDAYVFSMKVKSQYTALANISDSVVLNDPEGRPIECLWWGEERKPETAPVLHQLPESRGSVQRTAINGEFVRHQELPGASGELPYSPGVFDLTKKK